jgi:ribosomal protein S18 acetylase RimI-like enzyme
MNVAFRRATVDDAERVAAVTRANFSDAFGQQYPPQDLAAFLATTHGTDAERARLSRPDTALWLVEQEGEALGHLLVGPCKLPHAEVAAGDGEIQRFYLDRRLHNRGIGTRLFALGMDWLLVAGPRTLWVGVWSQNFGAQRFYARHGFAQVGEYVFPVGATRDHEFILRRPARP